MVGLIITLFPFLLLTLLLVVAIHFLIGHFVSLKHGDSNKSKLPQGSMGWPLVGETVSFLSIHPSTCLGDFLEQRSAKYGRVFKSHLFGSPTIVSCDPEVNFFVLQNEGKFFRVSHPKPMREIFGEDSVLTAPGDLHKRLRNHAVNIITASRTTPHFLHSVEEMSLKLLNSWTHRKHISFHEEMKKFTIDVMVKHLLSVEAEDELASNILEDFIAYEKGFVSWPVNIPGTAYAKAMKAKERAFGSVRKIMRERKKEMSGSGSGSELGEGKGDCLDMMLSRGGLSEEETVSLVLDLMYGGYETSAALLSLILYFLHLHPKAYQAFYEEHDAIRRSKKDGEPLTLEDCQKMEFSYHVMHESLRCGNVIKAVYREATEDVNFKGYFIPSGWKIILIFTAVHLDPTLHENPMEFNPWRWNTTPWKKTIMPFGGGPRLCPGQDLAKLEIAILLHYLVLTYRWKITPDDVPLALPYLDFTRGLRLEIEPLQTTKLGT